MRRKDNYVMVKRATPKRINLPNGRSFIARYKRVPGHRLAPNVMIKIDINRDSLPEANLAFKERLQGSRERSSVLLDNISKRMRKETLKSILDSQVMKCIVRRCSNNFYGRMGGTN